MKLNVKEALQAIRALLAEQPVEVKAEEVSETPAEEVKAEADAVENVEVEAAEVPAEAAPEVEQPDQKAVEMEQRLGALEAKLNELIQRMNGMQGVMMAEVAPVKKAIGELATVFEQFAELPTEEPTEKANSFQLPKKVDRLAEIADNVKAAKDLVKK